MEVGRNEEAMPGRGKKGSETEHTDFLKRHFVELIDKLDSGELTKEQLVSKLVEERLVLERNSERDTLTGAFNRGHMQNRIESEMDEAKESNLKVGVIMIDLDNFKKVNDSYGHQAGDRVLVNTVKVMETVTKGKGQFGRWGGEEFVVVLPNCSEERLLEISSKIGTLTRLGVGFEAGLPQLQTMSVGATFWNGSETIDELMDRTDKLMYVSKSQERNKLTLQVPGKEVKQTSFDEDTGFVVQ